MSAVNYDSEPLDLPSRGERVAEAAFARIGAVLLFRVALDIAYYFYVAPAFIRDPITPMKVDLNGERYMLSIVLVAIAAWIVPFSKRNLSGISYMAAMMFLYIPMTSMVGMNSQLPIDPVAITLFAIVVSLLFVALPLFPVVVIGHNGERRTVIISTVIIFAFIGWSIYCGAAGNVTFDYTKMYDFREANSVLLDVGAWSYIGLWAAKIFNPLILAVALHHRNKPLILFSLALQVYFFAITQHRLHLFTPLLVFMMYWLYSRPISLARIYVYASIALLAILAVVLAMNLHETASVLIRRSLYVAPSVAIDWLKYFADLPKIFWTDRYLFGRLPTQWTGIDLPYHVGLIKEGPSFSFSVGMVGAGYAQAGLLGVALYAAALGTVINFVNRLISRGVPVYIAAAILIGPIRTAWADSDLLTTLWSHGVIVGIIALAILGSTKNRSFQ